MVNFNGSLYVSICTGTPDNMPDENTMQSFAIVRGDKAADGTWTWTPVVGDKADGAKYTFGIDPERTRAGAGVLTVFNDYLYIGEYNDEEIAMENIIFDLDFTFMNKNFDQSVRLYRMDKNENVELVVGDSSKMFPKGSLSGLGSGFGHNENQYIWRMNVCDGKLYIGTFDTSSLLEPLGQFANFDLFKMSKAEWVRLLGFVRQLISMSMPKDGAKAIGTDSLASLRELFDRFDDKTLAGMFYSASLSSNTLGNFVENSNKYALDHDFIKNTIVKMKDFAGAVRELSEKTIQLLKNARYLSKATRGFDMYVTEDGVNFTTITTNGFGDPFNHGLRVFANTDSGMCIGTANPFWGTQLWKIEDVSGTEKPDTKPGWIFDDVLENSYYANAVKWAIDKFITKGVDDTHFAPNNTCTRAQAVTFLWRNAGCPAPESSTMPFTDVAKNAYYYDAVLWAVEKGITKGTTETTFSPNECCNRGQIATFLWRAAGSPAAQGSTMPFGDVAGNSYCCDAVLWAVNNGITKGTTETAFSPTDACTRGQIVTFLYRANT